MINLSEITIYYIGITFSPEKQKVIYASFSLMESFGKKFYEDKFIELIQRSDTIDSDTKQDMFMVYIEDEIYSIINEHYIHLSKEINISLNELNEIANFLYIIQSLEDYSSVTYRLYAEDTNKNIMVDIIESLTLLSKPRLMEIIEMIEDTFIKSLRDFITDKQDTTENIDLAHVKYIRYFFEFINNSECLGLTYFNSNFNNITLKELFSLIKTNIETYIDKTMMTNRAQAALDCLSILIVCKDSYELPLLKFKQNTSMFTNNLENVTKLEFSMLSILNDFNMFLTAKKQFEGLANAN